jgi:thiol-disulfide isomerase/thioredoxin
VDVVMSRPWRFRLTIVLVLIGAWSASGVLPRGVTAVRAAQRIDKEKASSDEMDRGRQLMQRDEYFEAYKAYKHANDLAGGRSAEAHVGMAQALTALKLHKNVIEACDAGIPLAEGNARQLARLHSLKGLALESLAEQDPAQLRLAEAEFRLALAADPEAHVHDLHFNLGVVLLKQHRDDEGTSELKKEIELRPHGTTAETAQQMILEPRRAREKFTPAFELVTSGGRRITPQMLRGSVVLLDFWGTWCVPCVKALPSLRKLQKAHASDPFVLVSISSDRDEQEWRKFIDKNAMAWPQYLDLDREVQRLFDVKAFPTYVLIDKEGIERLRVVGSGFDKASALANAIEQEVRRSANPTTS